MGDLFLLNFLRVVVAFYVEVNQGSKLSSCHSFPICLWNIHSLSSNNSIKVFLLRGYLYQKK